MSSFSVLRQCRSCSLRLDGSKRPSATLLGSNYVRFKIGSRFGMPTHHVPVRESQCDRTAVATQVFPFDQAWAPSVDAASLAPQLFAMSLFPYLCFLFFLTKSGKTPPLTLFGFYFLLVFVGATIPAGIYAKTHFGTSLANVDWLHGAAESLLTITNLFVVLGLRQGIREAEAAKAAKAAAAAAAKDGGEGAQGAAASASTPAGNVTR